MSIAVGLMEASCAHSSGRIMLFTVSRKLKCEDDVNFRLVCLYGIVLAV
jgi:hypothetical protein